MPQPRLAAVLALAPLLACATSGAPGPAAPPAPPAQAPARREVIRSVLPQNVRVVLVEEGTPVRSASGVVVGNGRTGEGAISYVLTNAHVVAPRPGQTPRFVVLVDLPTGDTQEFAAKLVAAGKVPEMDLALLAVPQVALDPAVLADDGELMLGDEVFVIAAPYGRSLSVSGGMVSQIDFERDRARGPSMIKTDAAIGYGASGGGLFSAQTGRLLGIVEGYRTAKVSIPLEKETYAFDVPMPGETFAAPAAKIRRFLASQGMEGLAKDRRAGAEVASGL